MCAVLAFLMAATSGAPTFEVAADHSNCLYRAGERVEFSVRVKGGGELLRTGLARVKLDAGGPGLVLTNRVFGTPHNNEINAWLNSTEADSAKCP